MNKFYENRQDELKAARSKVDEVQSKLCNVYECHDCPMRGTQGCFLDNAMAKITSVIYRLSTPKRLVYIAANGRVYNSKEEAMEDMYKHEQSKTQG